MEGPLNRLSTLIASSMLILSTPHLCAEEGMWTFNGLPLHTIEKQYGVVLTQDWIDHVQKSCLRVSLGGSASFVSPQGLLLTNHHVGSSAIYHLSTQGRDLMESGFLAKTFDEEIPCPNMYVDQLISIQDVTAEIHAKAISSELPEEREKARQTAIAEIKEKAQKETGLQPEVVSLYQGARYHLYLYQRYTDVRLVMAPEKSIAFFGGDADNFEYPRFDLDICFFRVYQDGVPLATKNFLKWSKEGPQLSEPLFVVGHPGKTRRMLTSSHLEFLRDQELSLLLKWMKTKQAKLQAFGQISQENRRIAEQDLFSIENSLKVISRLCDDLTNSSMIADKRKEEVVLFEKNTNTNPWKSLENTLESAKAYYPKFLVLEGLGSNYSKAYLWAKTLLRLSQEKGKPNSERLKEYTDTEIPKLELDLFSTEPVYKNLEKLRLLDNLQRTIDLLGTKHPVSRIIRNHQTLESRVDDLLNGTKLFDLEYRKELYSNLDAVSQSTDPFIILAKELDPFAREVREQKETLLDPVQNESYDEIAKILFERYGETVYPDATFTLRLSFGSMKGYLEKDQFIDPVTLVRGAFDKAKSHDFQEPFNLPQSWIAKETEIQKQAPLNFVSTNDIIGGNSGSPIINKNGELVGLIFDGNAHSISWSFKFDDVKGRATSVHSSGILEALQNIYGADNLIQEIFPLGLPKRDTAQTFPLPEESQAIDNQQPSI